MFKTKRINLKKFRKENTDLLFQLDGDSDVMKYITLGIPRAMEEIIEKSINNSTYEEGCLSVPGQFAEIDRPDKCYVKYLDYHGQPKEIKAEGMLATCIQHEIDHLEGILFIDYLSRLKKSMIIKKLSKQKKAIERVVI